MDQFVLTSTQQPCGPGAGVSSEIARPLLGSNEPVEVLIDV